MANLSKVGKSRMYIADFAVGNGELLRAANARWPKATFVGIDVNRRTVTCLSQKHPHWMVARCDFMNPGQRNRLKGLRKIFGKVHLVLLNPPFSNRGARRRQGELCGQKTTSSFGLAFLITALSYMAPHGKLFAILPAGTLESEMDRDAWRLICRFFSRSILKVNGDRTFKNCLAKTVVVRLVRRPIPKKQSSRRRVAPKPKQRFVSSVWIERGKVDMPSLNGAPIRMAVPLVHTTELKNNCIDLASRWIDSSRATVKSYAVLLPRVGRPTPDKICLYRGSTPLALSNCVLAIKCNRLDEAKSIQQKLLKKWKAIKRSYVGTCAQYMTLARLKLLLEELSFRIKQITAV